MQVECDLEEGADQWSRGNNESRTLIINYFETISSSFIGNGG